MLNSTSWTHKFRESFKDSRELEAFLGWELPSSVQKSYPLFVPHRLAEKIKLLGPSSSLAKQFLPHTDELNQSGLEDPIGDRSFSKAPQLIHRYPTRVLFTPTSVCPINCRYCFRKNELSPSDDLFQADFLESLAYLNSHPEISEIIFTGGDPLTLSNEKLAKYLEAFSLIPHIQHVRFHTRYPVILPERLDLDFMRMLQRYSQKFRTVSLVIHINHKDELDDESREKISLLSELSIQLMSQSVLLKGVNDDALILKELLEELVALKVRPYYLHHPDQVKGGMHFYLPLSVGREIFSQLRRQLPGWALPQYVIDIPGGHGKVSAFNPETFTYGGTLIGQQGQLVNSREPE